MSGGGLTDPNCINSSGPRAWSQSLSMLALVIPSPLPHFMRYLTIYSSFQAKKKFHDCMNRWTGDLGEGWDLFPWDLNFIYSQFLTISDMQDKTKNNEETEVLKIPFSLSLCCYPPRRTRVTTFTYLIEQNYFSFYYSSFPLQCTSWSNRTERGS